MRIKNYSSLGLKVSVNVPDSVEEYNTLAKRPNENAVLEDAVDNIVYRGSLADFREAFCEAVEANTGIARGSEVVKGKDGNPKKDDEGNEVTEYTENEATYFRRVCASTNRSPESFQDLADSVTAQYAEGKGFVADPTVRERKPAGPKTPPKSVYALADEIISQGKATHVSANLAKLLGRHVEHDREHLARAIHEHELVRARKAKEEARAALGA